MRLHAEVAPLARARVVQPDPAQNQSSENDLHCNSRHQIRSELPAEPDVLATEIPEQNAQERIETAMQYHRGMKPVWCLHRLRLNALSLPGQQTGNEAEG